jgi:phosphoribosyl 1,2-cyclic phosphate phosphodiesterase
MYFYGPENLEKIYDAVISPYGINPQRRKNVGFIVTEDKKSYSVGKYKVTAFTALHAPELGSLNYIIEDGAKSVLYLLDSGYPTQETLDYLQRRKQLFDCVIMDGTMGVNPPNTYIYHMGFEENKTLKNELLSRNLANKNTRFIVTHITHNHAETHEKIEEFFVSTGIDIAYDGYEIEL